MEKRKTNKDSKKSKSIEELTKNFDDLKLDAPNKKDFDKNLKKITKPKDSKNNQK